jgi:hypothetical protein
MVNTRTRIMAADTIATTIGRIIIIDRTTIIVTATAVITDIDAGNLKLWPANRM